MRARVWTTSSHDAMWSGESELVDGTPARSRRCARFGAVSAAHATGVASERLLHGVGGVPEPRRRLVAATPVATRLSRRAARSRPTAVYSTTTSTSHRTTVSGSDFTMNAAISTAGMPPSSRPSDARRSKLRSRTNRALADRHEERARAHHDRERGRRVHAEHVDHDHARRVETDAERHQRAEHEVAGEADGELGAGELEQRAAGGIAARERHDERSRRTRAARCPSPTECAAAATARRPRRRPTRPSTAATISRMSVFGSTGTIVVKMNACAMVGSVCPTLSVPGIRSIVDGLAEVHERAAPPTDDATMVEHEPRSRGRRSVGRSAIATAAIATSRDGAEDDRTTFASGRP